MISDTNKNNNNFINAVVIEDEDKSRRHLINMLDSYFKNVKIVATANSNKSGLEIINKHSPDLVFLNTILSNDNAFKMLADLNQRDFEIIFTSNSEEHAINAIRYGTIDYLIKPINHDDLKTALRKAEEKIFKGLELKKNGENNSSNNNHNGTYSSSNMIGLPTTTGLIFIRINDINVCSANGNYTQIVLVNNSKLTITKTLKQFEKLLSDFSFIRIHRSYLINLRHIQGYNRTNQLPDALGDGGSVIMRNSLQVPVSREKRKILVERLSKPF